MLFVPGNDPKLLTKAATTNADAIILDLEDAVQTADQKKQARELILNRLQSGEFTNSLVYCRLNDFDSHELLLDLEAIATQELDGIVYPKATGQDDVSFVDRTLTLIEQRYDITPGHFDIMPLIETPGGVLKTEAICSVSDRVVAVAFGCEDYVASLQGGLSSNVDHLMVPRSLIAMGARAAGVIPIDTVYKDIQNFEGFRSFIDTANKIGFEGSLTLHPEQVDIANEQYSPSQDDVEMAKKILLIAGKMEEKSVDNVDNLFVGPPIVRQAEYILNRHSKVK